MELFSGSDTHADGDLESQGTRFRYADSITRYASLDGSQLVAASEYTYDQYGRPTALVQTTSSDGTVDYQYDAEGNRLVRVSTRTTDNGPLTTV